MKNIKNFFKKKEAKAMDRRILITMVIMFGIMVIVDSIPYRPIKLIGASVMIPIFGYFVYIAYQFLCLPAVKKEETT